MTKSVIATRELEAALLRRSVAQTKTALERGANPNALFKASSALCLALDNPKWGAQGHGGRPWELAGLLLDAGAKASLSAQAKKWLAPSGELPLNKAVELWAEPEGAMLCERLLELGADPNAVDSKGNNAAHALASRCARFPRFEGPQAMEAWARLVSSGVRLKAKNKEGRDALQMLSWDATKSMALAVASLAEARLISSAMPEVSEAVGSPKKRSASL